MMKKFTKFLIKTFIAIIGILIVSSIVHAILLSVESRRITPNGIFSELNNNRIHIYSEGVADNRPTLLFMSGGATPAPVYDFKPIYSLFTDEYRIIVIERFGYGYSDIVKTERRIDIILEETRDALKYAGENSPFILFPHSVSGLEALYWLSKYPEEISAIIGLDMGFPEFYLSRRRTPFDYDLAIMSIISRIGIHRIFYPIRLSRTYFNENEYRQKNYLRYRNFMNVSVRNELRNIYNNAEIVNSSNFFQRNTNILLFSSNGNERGMLWINSKNEFAEKIGAEVVILDCDHYVHHYESQRIMEVSKQFLSGLGL